MNEIREREEFGPLTAGILRWWPIARTGLGLVLRRRLLQIILLLGLVNFLFHFAIVYLLAQLEAQVLASHRGLAGGVSRMAREFLFTGSGRSYRDFISAQNVVVMLLLALSGSILVGNDFRFRAVAFYLSKPVGKLHYFLGKLAAAATLVALLTLIPALVLYVEYGAFGNTFDYFRGSQRILWAIVGYGFLVSLTTAALLLGVCAAFQRTIPILCIWGAIFLFLPVVGSLLREIHSSGQSDVWGWSLLDLWSILWWVSNVLFGIRQEEYLVRLPWGGAVLCLWMFGSFAVFWRRVRAVEVVR